jgi:putative photosynthetic complex assembly protein 2
MTIAAAAIMFALFLWWFSTGAILMLVRLPRAAYPYAMITGLGIAVMALAGLVATRGDVSALGAFAGFTHGLIIWAALEMAFLFGYVTGPRKGPAPPDLFGWGRFSAAFATVAWHELSILAAAILLFALSWDAPNRVAADVFLLLFAMRISAKLNIFLGAPNVTVEFLPDHLRYLGSYFERRRVSGFFAFSVTLASLAFGFVAHAAMTAGTPYAQASLTLVATLLALAIIEHWFLVLPVRDAALWRWALGRRKPAAIRSSPADLQAPVFQARTAAVRAAPSPSRPVETEPRSLPVLPVAEQV